MAFLNETTAWELGIYQLETTDPVQGGADGIDNLQAKQLGNRTQFLKQFANEVISARGNKASLLERLTNLDSALAGLDPDMQNMMAASIKKALEMSAQATDGVRLLNKINQQQGEFTLYNYGIVGGCTLSKKGVSRLLTIADGVCYLEGRKYYVPAQDSAVSVPVGEATSATVYAYLQLLSGIPTLKITTVANPAPPIGIVLLASITIPATDAGADLAACTLSSRLCATEPDYPSSVGTPVSHAVPLAYNLPDTNYTIEFEVLSSVGSPCDERNLKVTTRNTNNFIVTLLSAADDVVVRWKLSRLNGIAEHPANDWRARFSANPNNPNYPTSSAY